MHDYRKSLELMIDELINHNKKNSKVDKLLIKSRQMLFDEFIEKGIEITREQYYRYIRAGSKSNIKRKSLESIYEYFKINHPDIYFKYIGCASSESFHDLDDFKIKTGLGSLDYCALCRKESKYLLYLSNFNNKSNFRISPTKSTDFPVQVHICKHCFCTKKELLNASYSELIEKISNNVRLHDISRKIGVNYSTINRIKNGKINYIDRLICEKIYKLFGHDQCRPMQIAIDLICRKITVDDVSKYFHSNYYFYAVIQWHFISENNSNYDSEMTAYPVIADKVYVDIEQVSLVNINMHCPGSGEADVTFLMEVIASCEDFFDIFSYTNDHNNYRCYHSFLFEIQVSTPEDFGHITTKMVNGNIVNGTTTTPFHMDVEQSADHGLATEFDDCFPEDFVLSIQR